MKVTNGYHGLNPAAAWRFDNENSVFVEDDYGSSWSIRSGINGGILVRCLGNSRGHGQIVIAAQVSNEIVLRSERP